MENEMNHTDKCIIVGLGNPGAEYGTTRHNIGFLCLDELTRRHKLTFGIIRQGCQAAHGLIAGCPVVLVKPLLYMNRSGEALAAWARSEDIELGTDPDDTIELRPILIVDDIALPLGALRMRERGSDGGHRGLESIARVFGGNDYPRLRLGVGGREDPIPPSVWADYVLEPFPEDDWSVVDDLVTHAADALEGAIAHDISWAGSRFNRRRSPLLAPEQPDEDLQSGPQ